MKKTAIFIGCLLAFFGAWSQTLKIKGCIRDLPYSKVYLAEVIAGKLRYIDSVLVNNGCFDFYVSDSIAKGMYTVVLSRTENAFLRLIMNGENIEFKSVFSKLLDSMEFKQSVENKIYYDYNKRLVRSSEKLDLLKKLTNAYSGNPRVLDFIKGEINDLNLQTEKYVAGLVAKYPSSLAVSFISAQQPVKVPAKTDTLVYKKAHYFDHVNFSNIALLRTDVIASVISGYLSLYENPSYTYTEQVENYALALDQILERSSLNSTIYDFLRLEFTNKFRYGNFDILGTYLMQYYPNKEFSSASSQEPDVKKRLKKLNNVGIGKQAPNIVMPTYDGKQTTLADIKSDYTLLVFWSTGCSHCIDMLPQLKQVYETKKDPGFEVLAVSFDSDRDNWQNFLKNGNYSWINYSDLKGWNSEIAKTYNIQGTPTYILLNKEKTVVYKPATLEELLSKLRMLHII